MQPEKTAPCSHGAHSPIKLVQSPALLTSHLVLAQDCLIKVTGYSITVVSQEAGNCIYFIVIDFFSSGLSFIDFFSRGLSSFIVLHTSLGPFSYSMTVTSFLFLAKLSLLTEPLGCSQYLRLTPPYSGRNIGLCFIDCYTFSRTDNTLLPPA